MADFKRFSVDLNPIIIYTVGEIYIILSQFVGKEIEFRI